MGGLYSQPVRPGIRKCPPLVTLTSGTAHDIYQPPGSAVGGSAATVATYSAIIRKIHVYNGEATDVTVDFGDNTGIYTPRTPKFVVVSGQDAEFTEDQIPCWDFTNTIQVRVTTASVGVAVLIEIELLEGGTAPV